MAIQQHKLRWSHSIEPWFLAYLLLGLTTGGLAMILIPVGMESFDSIGYIGLVTAVVGVGQLTAGAWGELADSYGLHRPLFGGGMLLVSLAFVGFALTSSVVPWTGMALLLGLGSSAALTVANLLIVERHPQEEWDSRVGWLQTAYSIGVVVGLAMAGVLTTFSTGTGMFVAAVTIAVAGVFGWLTTKTPTGRSYAKPHGFHLVPRAEIARTVPLRPTRHHLSLKSIEALGPLIRTPFGVFLAIWVASSVGVAACLSLYPLVMEHVFDIDSGASSGIMAVATAISILMYAPTGRLDKRIGAIRVLQTSLAARLIGFVALSVLGAVAFDGRTELAVVGVMLVILTGPLLTVSGTIITSRLSVAHEGQGTGLFNAANALAGLSGSAVGGFIAANEGFDAAWLFGAAGVGIGVLLSLFLQGLRHHESAPQPVTAPIPPIP
jgi:MFS family permease